MTAQNSSATLSPGCVHVYAWKLEESIPDESIHLALLSLDETARAGRFKFPKHRAAYLLAHANLRRILGGYCGCSPSELAFQSGRFGKPFLAYPRTAITFNLSHTDGFCAVAIAWSQPVGLDIERIRPIEQGVANAHFSAAELAALATLKREEWLRGFYRCWTSKEAVLKAEGAGLHIPLDSFDVQVLPDAAPQLVEAREPAGLQYAWRLHTVDVDPRVAGTLATTEELHISLFHYE